MGWERGYRHGPEDTVYRRMPEGGSSFLKERVCAGNLVSPGRRDTSGLRGTCLKGRRGSWTGQASPVPAPHKTAEEMEEIIVRAKGQHPSWGPEEDHRSPVIPVHPFLPAVSTASDILKAPWPRKANEKEAQEEVPRMHAGHGTGTQRHMECRLQRTVPDEKRHVLLPTHCVRHEDTVPSRDRCLMTRSRLHGRRPILLGSSTSTGSPAGYAVTTVYPSHRTL